MLKYLKKPIVAEILFLLGCIVIFIALRSFYFDERFAFFYDQPLFSTKALELWLNKSLVLIGPPTSLQVAGRYIFQGSIIYYMQLFFLLLAQFDPLKATYFFMIFSSIMIIPLYYGMKMFINRKSAILLSILYTTIPWYISATVSLWNPYFQFSLIPILILLMGLYKKYNNIYLLGLLFVYAGILLQFHYQFILVIIGLVGYYLFSKENKLKIIFVSCIGLIIGFLPILYFEIRNDFYNLRTIILFLAHIGELSKGSSSFQSHYVLTISFFILIIMICLFKKYITKYTLIAMTLLLMIWCLMYIEKAQLQGRPLQWTYEDELKVHSIITSEQISNYNIYMFYDPISTAQKYFLKKEGVVINYDDYYHNQYLYVVYDSPNFLKNTAYEVNTFHPSTVIKIWHINSRYTLYLLKRS